MELSEKVHEALNDFCNSALYSAHLHTALGAEFLSGGLNGFAAFFMNEGGERWEMSREVMDFIVDRGAKVAIGACEEPPDMGEAAPIDAVMQAYKHEQFTADQLNALAETAMEMKDYSALGFVQKLLARHIEEQEEVMNLHQKLELAGQSGPALLQIDKWLKRYVWMVKARKYKAKAEKYSGHYM